MTLPAGQMTVVASAGTINLAAGQTAVISGWLSVQTNPTTQGDITLYFPNSSTPIATETVNPPQSTPGTGDVTIAFEQVVVGPQTNYPVILLAQTTVEMTVQNEAGSMGGLITALVC